MLPWMQITTSKSRAAGGCSRSLTSTAGKHCINIMMYNHNVPFTVNITALRPRLIMLPRMVLDRSESPTGAPIPINLHTLLRKIDDKLKHHRNSTINRLFAADSGLDLDQGRYKVSKNGTYAVYANLRCDRYQSS